MDAAQEKDIYDLIIVGTGPAGLTAGLYAGRYRLKTLAIGQIEGGLVTESHQICNFPTELDISGFELAEKMKVSALSQGAELRSGEVVDIKKTEAGFEVKTQDGESFFGRTVLLATGTIHRTLGLIKEKKFLGRGVSYCATCDGAFYRRKVVAVVGGNDSALKSALYLAEVATKVYLIYRGQALRGEPAWVEKIAQKENIEVILNTNIKDLAGEEKLSGVEIDQPYQGQMAIPVDGVFIEIGTEPKFFDFMAKLGLETDSEKYIKVDSAQKTNVAGLWAAGDITTSSNGFRQIITAASEGAIAAESAFRHIQTLS